MKIFHVKIHGLIQLVKCVCSYILCFLKSKPTQDEEISEPIRIKVEGSYQMQTLSNAAEDIKTWNEWGDDPPGHLQSAMDTVDLFKDMQPQIKRPAMVCVPAKRYDPHFGIDKTRLSHVDALGLVGVELGTWDDSPSAWEDETMDDEIIEAETSKMIRDSKRQEREQRALEQQRRREIRELQKETKKQPPLGVKLR